MEFISEGIFGQYSKIKILVYGSRKSAMDERVNLSSDRDLQVVTEPGDCSK